VSAAEAAAPSGASAAVLITCRELVELLHDYLLGVLEPARIARVNAHLAACPSCVAYLKSYEAAIRMGRLALAPTDEPLPPEVPAALVRALLAACQR
jgi:anti-sigma factor RsiW